MTNRIRRNKGVVTVMKDEDKARAAESGAISKISVKQSLIHKKNEFEKVKQRARRLGQLNAVSTVELSEVFKKMGLNVDPSKIVSGAPIKKQGDREVTVLLCAKIPTAIKINLRCAGVGPQGEDDIRPKR